MGYSYTWEKSRGSQIFVEENLDRALALSTWHSAFANAYVQNEEATSSDHSAICLQLGNSKAPYSPRFRFENAWIREEECRNVITKCWKRHRGGDILNQIYACGGDLQTWGRNQLNLFKKKVQACHKRIWSLKSHTGETTARQMLEARKELRCYLPNRRTTRSIEAKGQTILA